MRTEEGIDVWLIQRLLEALAGERPVALTLQAPLP